MTQQYRILSGKHDNKPVDMVVIMRRIRSGKIHANTLICVGDSKDPVPAGQIEELARFFRDDYQDEPYIHTPPPEAGMMDVIRTGWHFTIESNIMTVYAGGMLILTVIIGLILIAQFGFIIGVPIGWCLFSIMHQLYFVFIIRMFRGQTIGDDFMNNQFAPGFPSLILFSMVYAIVVGFGLMLFVFPGIFLAALLAFVPVFMIDRQLPLEEAVVRSYKLLRKAGPKEFLLVYSLCALHLLCILLLIPVPITMPLFLASLCEVYEKNSL